MDRVAEGRFPISKGSVFIPTSPSPPASSISLMTSLARPTKKAVNAREMFKKDSFGQTTKLPNKNGAPIVNAI